VSETVTKGRSDLNSCVAGGSGDATSTTLRNRNTRYCTVETRRRTNIWDGSLPSCPMLMRGLIYPMARSKGRYFQPNHEMGGNRLAARGDRSTATRRAGAWPTRLVERSIASRREVLCFPLGVEVRERMCTSGTSSRCIRRMDRHGRGCATPARTDGSARCRCRRRRCPAGTSACSTGRTGA
jgi:hypothetical protein